MKRHVFTAEVWERAGEHGGLEMYCWRIKADSTGAEGLDLDKFASVVIGNTLIHCGYEKPFGKPDKFDFFKKVNNVADALQREYEYLSTYIAEHAHSALSEYDADLQCNLNGEHIDIKLILTKR
jgi:hypothetical protein